MSSGHTFPCNRSAPDVSEEGNMEETPNSRHTTMEESSPLDSNEEGDHMLCWEGFTSHMEANPMEQLL